MTTYHVEFGHLGEGRPVPDLTVTADSIDEFCRAVDKHAKPHLEPVLTKMGRPELADSFFHTNAARSRGQFVWLDLASGDGARFCGARITEEATA